MDELLRNEKQVNAFISLARFLFLLCGRRSGKTYLIKHKICNLIRNSPPGSNILYMAPTNPQAKALMWNELEDLFYSYNWTFTPNIAGQYFVLTGGRRVFILGAEKFNRIRGLKFFHIFLDEFAFFTKKFSDIWRALRPTLSDTGGGATLATTPDGKATEAYDVYLAAKANPDWEVHTWNTEDNLYIDRKEIEDAKRELDEKSYKQEYEAEWISKEGLAYYSFDEKKHIIKQPPLNFRYKVHMCLDFNIRPSTLLLSQYYENKLKYKKEYSLNDVSTEKTVELFCEDHKEYKNDMIIAVRGDSTGNNRTSATGKSDYFYLRQVLDTYGFQYEMEVPRKNPPIVDRVKHVNSWLQPMLGPPKIEIDPSCKNLIKDLAAQELKGRHPSDANNLGHKADAFGYDIFWQNRELTASKPSQIQL